MKLIFISGPSGSGKTTLSNQIIKKNKNGIVLSTDNYYKTGLISKLLSKFVEGYFDRSISFNKKLFKKEEIINTEVKDLRDGIGKYVEFTVVETDKKGGKYRIINCFPSEEPQDSIIKTVKTNYKLSN